MRFADRLRAFTGQNALGLLALFLILGGGGAIAASGGAGGGRDSIGAKQIKADAVGSSEIRKNAVGTQELRSGAVGSSEIADGSISLGDVDFQVPQRGDVGVRGTTETGQLNLQSTGFETVATQEFNLPESGEGSGALILGQVTLTDIKDGNDSPIELRVVHNGHVEGEAVFADTVTDGKSRTAPVSIQDSGFHPGANTISIEVRVPTGGANVLVGARSLQVVQFGPIFNPPAS